MQILLLTADLATQSRVAGAAARNNDALTSTSSAETLWQSAETAGPALVVLDLSTPGLDVRGVVALLRSLPAQPVRIIAFGPHVHEALLQASRDAGCDQVLSRGQFFARLDDILIGARLDD